MNTIKSKKIINNITVIISAILILFFMLSGCASKPGPIKTMPRSDDYRFKPAADIFQDSHSVKKSDYPASKLKTGNLIILLDEGVEDKQRLNKTLKNLLVTLPGDLQYKKTIKSFGFYNQNKDNLISLTSELIFYNKNNSAEKNTDIIILTQWKQINNQSIQAAEQLLIKANQKFCLHLIGIGNIHQNKRLTKPQYCGSSASSESLLAVNKMKKFVADIFFQAPLDTDRDGIDNSIDQCPYTPANTIITWNGCARNSKTSNPRYLILKDSLTMMH